MQGATICLLMGGAMRELVACFPQCGPSPGWLPLFAIKAVVVCNGSFGPDAGVMQT